MESRDIDTGGIGKRKEEGFFKFQDDLISERIAKRLQEPAKDEAAKEIVIPSNLDRKEVVKAALFMAGRVDVRDLSQVLGMKVREVKDIVKELKHTNLGSLEIARDGMEIEMRVKEEYLNVVRDICPRAEFTEGELRTLALIAYYQPLSKLELVKHRGIMGHVHVAKFKENGFITETEDKKLITTDKFERYFGVKGLKKEDIDYYAGLVKV